MATRSTPRPVKTPKIAKRSPTVSPARIGSMKQVRYDLGYGGFGASRSYYEAASNSPSFEFAPDYGPNSANGELEKIRRRSRWTFANDGFYANACRQIANNVIGYGIKPRIKDPVLRKLWRKWEKEADARGVLDLHLMAHALWVSTPRDGEVFVRVRPRRKEDMKSGVPFQLQILEADYVPIEKNEVAPNGNLIISGIEKDQIDRVQAYWMYDYHPKDFARLDKRSLLPKRVPANDVLHVYRPDRFEAMRGVPWGAPALNKAESLKTYDEAEVERKKGQAMHGGFITPPVGEDGKAVMSVDGQDAAGIDFHGMSPGTWTITPAGYQITLSQPQGNDANYPLFRREGMTEVAVSFGLSVEHVTLNFEKLNDRQWRANNLEVTRAIESYQEIAISQFYRPIWQRFVEACYLAELWQPEAGKTVADYYDIEYMPPARGHIHPVQEVAALREAIRIGVLSRKRVASMYGDDVEDIDEENALDQQRAMKLGLRYDVYSALEGMDFNAILQSTLIEDTLEELDTSGASDPGSIMSAG
ncbi:phage portal protein [Gellertiella hungarica]|uniref:Lambda family phage portal protein n=1 Tax=Gellertiella hungarica TaxID=1572859 RepID=A0A7W6NJ63_9HYPH|nr:phage portal protein [Gellertiella hungarica]MBB4064040.1 lambda family phage portal protein [Gellertiella hungarica]